MRNTSALFSSTVLMLVSMVLPNYTIIISALSALIMDISLTFMFEGCLFLFILLLISLSIIVFSNYYMHKDLYFPWFMLNLFLFILSMILLIVSNSGFVLFCAWDGLGVTSFTLVLYYMNWESVNGSMITIMTNRIGDYTLFWLLVGSFAMGISYSNQLLMPSLSLLIITSFTKSAQMPFSAWLPRAMSAPTPISALVHSSTLVVAGVVMLMKYSCVLYATTLMCWVALAGVVTLLVASFSALVEVDIKKVVALSTLSQLGFLMLTLGLGMSFYAYLHLISHALFKSCLFLQIGSVMHSSYSSQDSRTYLNSMMSSLMIRTQLLLCLLCLCGFTFTSGFVTKDLVLEMMGTQNTTMFFYYTILSGVFMTFLYSLRVSCALISVSPMNLMFNSISFWCLSLSWSLIISATMLLWWSNLNCFSCPMSGVFTEKLLPLSLWGLVCIWSFYTYKTTVNSAVLFTLGYSSTIPSNMHYLLLGASSIEMFSLKSINTCHTYFSYMSKKSFTVFTTYYSSLVSVVAMLFIIVMFM